MYCNFCKILIKGKYKRCPLCENLLKEKNIIENPFPYVPTVYEKYNALFKFMIFLSVVVSLGSVFIYSFYPIEVKWYFFVIFGILSVWISVLSALGKRSNITRTIFYEALLFSFGVLLWDYFTGFHGWSYEYVLPTIYSCSMIAMSFLSYVFHINGEDSILYFFIVIILGLIPFVLLLLHILTVYFPSLLCVLLSTISLTVLIVFKKEEMILELQKRFHF